MATFIESGTRALEVLEVSREEAVTIIRGLTDLLLRTNGNSPSLEVNEKGCRTYQLYFQVGPKTVETPGIPSEEDSTPPLLKGPLET